MKIYKSVTVIAEELSEVKCNCCGKTMETDKFGYTSDYLSVTKKWGYGTELDGETHSFDICEDCYNDIISKFKIPVKND